MLDALTKKAVILVEMNKAKKEFPTETKRPDERFDDGFAVSSSIPKQLQENADKIKLSSEDMAKLNGKMAEMNKLAAQNPEEFTNVLAESVSVKTLAMKEYLYERKRGVDVYDAGTIAEIGTKKLSKETKAAVLGKVWKDIEEAVFASAPNKDERDILKAIDDDRNRVSAENANGKMGAYPVMTSGDDRSVNTLGVYMALRKLTAEKDAIVNDEAKKQRLSEQFTSKPASEVRAFALEALKERATTMGNKSSDGIFATVYTQGIAKGLDTKTAYSLVRWDVSNTIRSEDKPFHRFQEITYGAGGARAKNRPTADVEIENARMERIKSLPVGNDASMMNINTKER